MEPAMANKGGGAIDVEYVARLARIDLTDAEKVEFQSQLAKIVSYVGVMRKLDLSAVAPMSHVFPVENVFRADAIRPGLNVEEVMKNAPDSAENQFRVPKIVE